MLLQYKNLLFDQCTILFAFVLEGYFKTGLWIWYKALGTMLQFSAKYHFLFEEQCISAILYVRVI